MEDSSQSLRHSHFLSQSIYKSFDLSQSPSNHFLDYIFCVTASCAHYTILLKSSSSSSYTSFPRSSNPTVQIKIRFSTLLYSTLLYSTLLYSTLLYSTLLYSTQLNSTLFYSTLLYSILLHSPLLTLLSSTPFNLTLLCPTLIDRFSFTQPNQPNSTAMQNIIPEMTVLRKISAGLSAAVYWSLLIRWLTSQEAALSTTRTGPTSISGSTKKRERGDMRGCTLECELKDRLVGR